MIEYNTSVYLYVNKIAFLLFCVLFSAFLDLFQELHYERRWMKILF